MGWENTGRGDEDGASQGEKADGAQGGRPGGAVRAVTGPHGVATVRQSVDLNAAAAVCAAQLPAVALVWWIGTQLGDDYDSSAHGLALLLGLACLLVVAPLVLPFVGLLHAVAHIVPADLLARRAARRLRGPAWAWHLLCTGAVGAAWGALVALLWGLPFLGTVLLLAGLGVLPALGLAHFRRRARVTGRPRGLWAVWLPSLLGSVTLFLLVLVGGVLATVAGLVEDYEPPVLSAEQLAGDWSDGHGAALRLGRGGDAELTKVPAQPRTWDDSADPPDPAFTRCDGTGTWDLRTEDPFSNSERDGVLVRLRGGCGDETYWMIGGTAAEPELFVLFGDPDAGDLRILKRDA